MSRVPGEIRLQPLARSRVASLGAVGAAWLESLPGLVAELAEQWDLTVGRGLPGGSAGYVAAVTRSDGTPAVLKVACVGELTDEATVLDLAEGQGYARLFESDAERQALLLERLGPPLGASGATPEHLLEVLGETLSRAWAGLPLDRAATRLQVRPDKAPVLVEAIERWWVEFDRPCSAAAVDRAVAYAAELADPEPAGLVVLHGDPHPHNALRVLTARPGAETGYAFVDPDGFVGDRSYDLGVAVRDWTNQLSEETARARIEGYCAILAAQTGVDADRIWAWGFLERVSTGLYVTSLGAHAVAEPFLRTADWLVGE